MEWHITALKLRVGIDFNQIGYLIRVIYFVIVKLLFHVVLFKKTKFGEIQY